MHRSEGFSLIEMMVAMAVMLLISGAAVSALLKMSSAQATIWNRTQMHSGIRGATEVMQQEVGQAGRIALPNTIQLGTAITKNTTAQTVSVTCTGTCASNTTAVSGLFVGEKLTIDAGCSDTLDPCTSVQEVVALTGVDTSAHTISAIFTENHALDAPVQVFGGFSAGVVPPSATNGSTGSVLKLFGDINADGSMVYVEYTCDTSTNHVLYRNSVAFDATSKPTPGDSQVLLGNVVANPNSSPCFTYQTSTVSGTDYVLDVAITLTVQTQQIDPVTKAYQTETKALLNVAPRNVFNAWELATLSIMDRVQATPPSVTSLLP